MSLYLWYTAIDFGIQWAAFCIAAFLQTEKFYDITGSLTFVIVSIYAYKWANQTGLRKIIQTGMILVWAVRLGSYLFNRILQDGKDKRFNNVRDNPPRFFVFWTLQGVWVMANLLPSLVMISSNGNQDISWKNFLGWSLWGIGFLCEVIADYQKSNFRSDPLNRGKFISSGLWSISRHPNYLGEISLWLGLYISALPGFSGGWGQSMSLLCCPLFNAFLITRLSGIPPLEKSGSKKWGHEPAYKHYLKTTAVLVPFIW